MIIFLTSICKTISGSIKTNWMISRPSVGQSYYSIGWNCFLTTSANLKMDVVYNLFRRKKLFHILLVRSISSAWVHRDLSWHSTGIFQFSNRYPVKCLWFLFNRSKYSLRFYCLEFGEPSNSMLFHQSENFSKKIRRRQ